VRELRTHKLFEAALALKAVNSLAEIAGGLALLVVPSGTILHLAMILTHQELIEDPGDWLGNYLLHAAESLSTGQKAFAAYYLLSHGAVKLFLVVNVMREKQWAYPAFMAALALLVAYQSFKLAHVFTIGLAALTVLDLVVLGLTWPEYRSRLPKNAAARR
jgi:uncharacterized membrane protein